MNEGEEEFDSYPSFPPALPMLGSRKVSANAIKGER